IAHAPSNRQVKGTPAIIEAVAKLEREGEPITLNLIEGKTHEETLRQFADADLVIDQLIIGWYGSVSVEAMALGRPVICYLDPLLVKLSGLNDLPIVSANETDCTAVLRDLLHDPKRRRELGRHGPAFVRRVHHPQALVRQLERYW
ncbi:glycosyltransferase family 1 protein, partial [Candidatus Berkelbacteria bacterium]|nr:glycosyltransferase family 1 protein [Candidatus Berkelbacteria bacterium]